MGKKRGRRRVAQKQQKSHGPNLDQSNTQETVQETVNNKSNGDVSEKVPKSLSIGPTPVGLSNLGNTCFFNSIMQNLIQTPLLDQLLKQEIKSSNIQSITINPNNGETPALEYTPTSLGELSLALSNFFDAVKATQDTSNSNRNTKKQNRDRVVSPKNLFTKLCSKNERFRGFQQQDSQELYHCLLDSVRTEEIKRKKKGILKALDLNKQQTDDVPEELRQRLKVYGRQLSEKEDTIVEKVFGGALVSSVLCDSCGTVTAVTEPFYDVSLPIADIKPDRKPVVNNRNSDESDDTSEQASNQDKKPMSKHALKQLKKKEEKEMRRRRKQQKFKSDEPNQIDSVDSMASSLAMEAITSAMVSMSLADSLEEIKIASADEAAADSAQLNGGAEDLNLPDSNGSDVEAEKPDTDADVKPVVDVSRSEAESASEKEEDGDDTSFDKNNSFFDTPQATEPVYTPVELCQNCLPASLKPRDSVEVSNCSIQSCFYQFTMPEILTGSNKFGCETCTKQQSDEAAGEAKTVYCNASKQILIKSPPQVLTIHLKRFQQVRCRLQKVNKFVSIPSVLDIAPFCLHTCKEYADSDLGIQYSLYGLVEHTGSLSRGHYTAYVRTRLTENADSQSDNWYHISDTRVTKVTASKAFKSNAYILFYERIQSPVR